MNTLRFYFVTWNVATKSPGQDLNALLDFPSQYNKNKQLADFYVIGLQEVKSQPQNIVMDSLFSDPWTTTINKILCRQGLIIAKSIRLQGILLLVYVQLKHLTHLRDIEAQYTKTGLGGMWGNKGAVSVRFNIYGCSLCLVNCHLAAHEHLLANRIDDYNTIIKQHTYHVSETSNILYHDYVFWLGDLNFRVDHPSGSSPTSDQIVEMLKRTEKDNYDNLLKHDQLFAVKETGEAFSEFTEHEIRFPPTYKFFTGTDAYDVKRKPSWTDRILYKVNANVYENVTLRAEVLSYHHIPHYTVSDHKPVIAVLNIKIRQGFTHSIVGEPRTTSLSSPRMLSAFIKPQESSQLMTEEIGQATRNVVRDAVCDDEAKPELDDQAFSNYTEKIVKFAHINRVWYIGDPDFRTQCTLSPDVVVNASDWIGIYDANFNNLDDYISYEYLARLSVPHSPGASPEAQRTITLSFPVGSGVRTPGFYRFIYFSQPSDDVRSVLGISDPFEVSSKEDRLVALETSEQASSSTSPRHTKTRSATTDIFTDFTGLDVAKLSRHFSNDLSID